MSIERTTAKSSGLTRDVIRDSKSGESYRDTVSGKGLASLGQRSSIDSARNAAARDIDRGPRAPGDLKKRT